MMLRPSTIELNPELAQAWKLVLGKKLHNIQGWTKSQQHIFVEQIVLSALHNQEKCLVLTSNPSQAEELKIQLTQRQILDFCAFHQSESFGESLVQQAIDQKILKKNWPKINAPSQFEPNFDKLEQCRLRLNKLFQAVRQPVFGNLNWPELVGLYWSKQTQAGSGLLSISLAEEKFDFDFSEFKLLYKQVHTAFPLYQELQRLDHPLRQLNPQIFLKKNHEAALNFCEQKLRAYLRRFDTLLNKYNQQIEEYGRLLRQHFEENIQFFLTETNQLLDQINNKSRAFGGAFLDAKHGRTKWLGPLSSQGKSAISAYKQLIQDYETLKSKFERVRWFSFVWPPVGKATTIAPLKSAIEAFENALKNGHIELGKFVQEEQLRLNANSALPELAARTKINALEEEMDDLLAELNETELINGVLENKMLTLNKRKQYLIQVKEQLVELQKNLPEFGPFYSWQRFWLQLSPLQQNLLKALIENRIEGWPAAFENWYYNQVLLKSKSIDAPLNTPPLEEYQQLWTQFLAQLPDQIRYLWQKRQKAWGLNLKSEKKGPKKTKAEGITTSHFEAYTELFPLLVLHPSTLTDHCQNIPSSLFEWIVILETNEGSGLNFEHLSRIGKRLVVISSPDELQQPVSRDDLPTEDSRHKSQEKSAFWSVFQQNIRPYFEKQRIGQNIDFNDFNVPMSLFSSQKEEVKVAFLADGFLSQGDATDFAWEYQKQKQLQQEQWEIMPIWSAVCWQNLANECRRIAALIIGIEKQKKN